MAGGWRGRKGAFEWTARLYRAKSLQDGAEPEVRDAIARSVLLEPGCASGYLS